MEYNHQEHTTESMSTKEMKRVFNYFNKKFATFTFNFAKKVKHIYLISDVEPYCEQLSVKELFELQRELRQLGGLANWITLEIHFVNGTFSYMSFDH